MEKAQYIITEDTPALFKRLNGVDAEAMEPYLDSYFYSLVAQLDKSLGDRMDISPYTFKEIDQRLQTQVQLVLQEDPDSVCLCLDRFLLSELETDVRFQDRFYRFGICRNTKGERVPRQQSPTFSEQLGLLAEKVPDIYERSVILVDDGIFTGGTVNELLELARSNGVQLNVNKIIGFIGMDQERPDDQPETTILEPIPDLYEWIDIRDFTPLGGKMLNRGKANRLTSSVPYIYPWSDGNGATLDMEPDFFEISTNIITSFRDLVITYEQQKGDRLTFRDVVQKGFPFPTDQAKTLPVTLNTSVVEYLDMCIVRIDEERARPVVVLDMDGTLYNLDGKDRTYSGSSLESAVIQNARRFIVKMEQCSNEEADEILNAGLKNDIGLSSFLAQRYDIARTEYFNKVWDIDPEGIVDPFADLATTVQAFARDNPRVKTIVLSSSPSIWISRVLSRLGIEESIEMVIGGEKYTTKDEVFRMLATRYSASNIVSIGDQEATDIVPAQQQGIQGLQVQGPGDVIRILKEIII